VPLLIENTSGSGGHIGSNVAELRALLDELDTAGVRAALCVDFAHAHAAAWDLGHKSGLAAFVDEWRAAGLLERVALVHANDSAAAPGSHRDWHANPGTGLIGARGLRLLAAFPEFARVPWILEVPGAYRSGPRLEDVTRLVRIVSTAARSRSVRPSAPSDLSPRPRRGSAGQGRRTDAAPERGPTADR
jgi:endonuclease IV